jgi:hypothetical protein
MDQKVESTLDYQRFAQICKALGHPARLRIIEHLKAIDHCICGEIVQILPLAQCRELQQNCRVNLNPQHAYQICEAKDDIVLPGRKGSFPIRMFLPEGSRRFET